MPATLSLPQLTSDRGRGPTPTVARCVARRRIPRQTAGPDGRRARSRPTTQPPRPMRWPLPRRRSTTATSSRSPRPGPASSTRSRSISTPAPAARRASPPATASTASTRTRPGATSACSSAARPTLPVLQHVTTACHHCLEPACLNGCPVDAYEKDPVTGIVRHLDDQCFGCQYCTLTCPYDVPKYNTAKGIVRKCDMCSDRLAAGEAPACVQACPNEAIRIRVVDTRRGRRGRRGERASCPARAEPELHAADDRLQDAPGPAAQHAAGRLLPGRARARPPAAGRHARADAARRSARSRSTRSLEPGRSTRRMLERCDRCTRRWPLALGLLALAASTLHLGRPLYAFRAMLGLRHSWLSREIVAFGLFATLATAYAACRWLRRAVVARALTIAPGRGASPSSGSRACSAR